MKLTLIVWTTRSKKFATFPQNVLLRVAYTEVRDDVTVKKQNKTKNDENRAEGLHNSATFWNV